MSNSEITDKEVAASDDDEASPAELLDSNLDDRYSREFTIADDDHPLVVTAGSKEELKSSVPPRVHRMLSDELYQDPDVFWREWLQNHVAACIREAQRVIRTEHPDGADALYNTIEHDHPDLTDTRTIRLPKTQRAILRLARDFGYDPTIEFIVNADQRKVTSIDNGIGMTTGEAIEAWNEPVQSGSGTDQLSAGTKGIGSLTWFAISGDDGLAMVKTRTRRETTAKGTPVPQRDRDGYWFAAYLGGILPASGDIEDEFYGTKFEIPVREDLNMASFQSSLERYLDLPPVGVVYTYKEDGVSNTEEYRPTAFGQHIGDRDDDSHPAIRIERPGEFNIALDTSDYILNTNKYKHRHEDDTWLLNFAIDRNEDSELEFETMYNDQLQLENEQGLLVAGPNRGKLHRNVDTLAGDVADIENPTTPMPDVPLPEPTSSRDEFKRDEALTRFLTYANFLAKREEVDRIADFVNGMLDTADTEDLLKYLRRNSERYPLFRKMAAEHGDGLTSASTIWSWFSEQPKFDFDPTDAPQRAIREHQTNYRGEVHPDRYKDRKFVQREHPSHHVPKLLAKLEKSYSWAKKGYGNPDRKKNRKKKALWEILVKGGNWPIFVGATLNQDKCKVIWNTYPKAAIMKTRSYAAWQKPPWHARLVKNVPLDTEEDHRFNVPDSIVQERQTAKARTKGAVNVDADLKIRTEGQANVQLRKSWSDVHDALVDADFGDYVSPIDGDTLVVFQRGDDRAISDNYGLSGYPGVSIVNTTKGQARDLLQFEQVFDYDGLREHIESLSFPAYYPTNGRYYEVDFMDLYADKQSMMCRHEDARLAALLQRKDHKEVDYWKSRQHYLHGSELMLDKFYDSDKVEDDARVVFYTRDQMKWLHVHFDYYTGRDVGKNPNTLFVYSTNSYRPNRNLRRNVVGFDAKGYSNMDRDFKRTQHPAWNRSSSSWKRHTSHRLNGVETEMYLACRDLGIDPYDFGDNPEQLRYLLTQRCKGGRR